MKWSGYESILEKMHYTEMNVIINSGIQKYSNDIESSDFIIKYFKYTPIQN